MIHKTISVEHLHHNSKMSIPVTPPTASPEITGEHYTRAGHAGSVKELELFVAL